ncbi:MAG: FAD-dependent monooxygenase, partial [Kordiimonadaceae bacterium]|nr:FAD-dependent monooxygenase [Kordiimonadaceae bacterium]
MNLSNIPVFKKKTYAKAPELSGEGKARHSFIIVGSGLIGLAVALDLARKGHAVILVTAYDFIAAGSKAICFAKQSLDIFDRLGVCAEIVARGVTWNIGKVYRGEKEEPIYQFDMLPEKNQKNPAFINIPQYSAEDIMIDALEQMDNVEIRWGHQVKDIDVHGGDATLFITTRDGDYTLETDYVLACDGSHSKVRECLQLDFQGRVFEDNFLIVDVKFQHDSPSERKFWFDPPFNRGRTALLHKQPDD